MCPLLEPAHVQLVPAIVSPASMGASVSSVFRGTILMRLELVSFAQARVSPATIAELVYSAQLINT